jgi:hypothetical protein
VLKLFSLAVTPICIVGAVVQYVQPVTVCTVGSSVDMMLAMWIVMAVAHLPPWFTR